MAQHASYFRQWKVGGDQACRGGVAEIVKQMSGSPALVRTEVKLFLTLLVNPNTSWSLTFGKAIPQLL